MLFYVLLCNILLRCLTFQETAHTVRMSVNSFDEDNLTHIRPHFSLATSSSCACAANFHVYSYSQICQNAACVQACEKVEHTCFTLTKKSDSFGNDGLDYCSKGQ